MRCSAAGSAAAPLHEVAERGETPADRDLVGVRVRRRLGVRGRVLEDGARDLDQRADDDVPVLRPDQLAGATSVSGVSRETRAWMRSSSTAVGIRGASLP